MEVFFEVLREGAPPALAGAPLDRTSQPIPVFVGSATVRSRWLPLDGGAQVLVSVRVVEELDASDTFLHPEAAQQPGESSPGAGGKRLEAAPQLDVMTVVEFEPVWNSQDAGTPRTVRRRLAPSSSEARRFLVRRWAAAASQRPLSSPPPRAGVCVAADSAGGLLQRRRLHGRRPHAPAQRDGVCSPRGLVVLLPQPPGGGGCPDTGQGLRAPHPPAGLQVVKDDGSNATAAPVGFKQIFCTPQGFHGSPCAIWAPVPPKVRARLESLAPTPFVSRWL